MAKNFLNETKPVRYSSISMNGTAKVGQAELCSVLQTQHSWNLHANKIRNGENLMMLSEGRKKFLVSICSCILVLMLVSLCSCGKEEAPNVSENSERPNPHTEIVHIAVHDTPSIYAASPTGVYSILQMQPGSYNLFYADANTQKETYLCATPNCTHSSDECTSYISMEKGVYGFTLGFYNDHLYLFQNATTNDYLPYLMQLDADGNNKKIIASLNKGENFIGNVYGYGNSILCEISRVSEQGSAHRALIQIDLGTGKRTDLISYPQGDTSYSLMGASKTELIYLASGAKGNQYFTVNLADEGISLKDAQAANTITEFFDGNDLIYTVQQDYLCKYDRLKNELSYQDLNTKQTQSFLAPELLDGDTLYGLVHLFDDQLALTIEDNEGITCYELIDSKTGTLSGVRIKISAEDQWFILGEYGDRLVYLDSMEEKELKKQGEASMIGETALLPVYQSVSKTDFLNGKAGETFQQIYN